MAAPTLAAHDCSVAARSQGSCVAGRPPPATRPWTRNAAASASGPALAVAGMPRRRVSREARRREGMRAPGLSSVREQMRASCFSPSARGTSDGRRGSQMLLLPDVPRGPVHVAAVGPGGGGAPGGDKMAPSTSFPSSPSSPDVDVAVFRFSLGLSFLDDKYVPRVAGAVLGSLLLLNHWLTSAGTTPAQQVSEVAGAVMACVLLVVPAVESRLQEAKGGRRAMGSSPRQQAQAQAQAGAGAGAGAGASRAVPVFALCPALPPESAQELAWASYSLMRNTNTQALLVVKAGSVLCLRGLWDLSGAPPQNPGSASGSAPPLAPRGPGASREQGAGNAPPSSPSPSPSPRGPGASREQALGALQAQLAAALAQPGPVRASLGGEGSSAVGPTYAPTLGTEWDPLTKLVPGAASILVQPLGPSPVPPGRTAAPPSPPAVLVLVSDSPRAFSARDRAWVEAMCSKLSSLELL